MMIMVFKNHFNTYDASINKVYLQLGQSLALASLIERELNQLSVLRTQLVLVYIVRAYLRVKPRDPLCLLLGVCVFILFAV